MRNSIFISWSKEKSKEIAILLKTLLESFYPDCEIFMSEENIVAGEAFQTAITQQIETCEKLLICFTTDNKFSPWLSYEVGFGKGLNKTVIPILFDEDPYWNSWRDNPLYETKPININADDFKKTFLKSLNLTCSTYMDSRLNWFIEEVKKINTQYKCVDDECELLVNKLICDSNFKKESPIYKEKVAYFSSGFETTPLWIAIIESFLYSGKYLWIYGRKNMKLFCGGFTKLFEYLNEKSVESSMSGIDFRCLFLNPDSKEVEYAHTSKELFKQELNSTITRAKIQIGTNPTLQKCFRMYSHRREEVIIRVDNCIIYSKPYFDHNGCPQIMTDSKFEIFSAFSQKGKECIEKYENIWNNATNLF